jgi:hypothetical protein
LAGHVECTIKNSNGQIMLVGKYFGKRPLGKIKGGCGGNIEMDFK